MRTPIRPPLSWEPVRRGAIYCAPACGGGCTWAAYLKASDDAERLRRRLKGKGWKIRVQENLGWHWSVRLRTEFGAISVSDYGSGTYGASLSDHPDGVGGLAMWSDRFYSKDPNAVVRHALEHANEVLSRLVLSVESILEAVETER